MKALINEENNDLLTIVDDDKAIEIATELSNIYKGNINIFGLDIVFKDDKTLMDKINTLLRKTHMYAEEIYLSDNDTCLCINIEGDWKHTHAAMRYLIEKAFGIKETDEKAYESDEDWYESIHYFDVTSYNGPLE